MRAKYSEATLNRPEGNRVTDAPFVVADIEKYRRLLKREPAWKKNDRNGITIYKTIGITILLTYLHKNATMDNSVSGLLTIQVIEGSIDCIIENTIVPIERDQLITLHPEVIHTIRAKEDSLLLLTNNMAV